MLLSPVSCLFIAVTVTETMAGSISSTATTMTSSDTCPVAVTHMVMLSLPMCPAVCGDCLPLLPPLLLASWPTSRPHDSSSCFLDTRGSAAEPQDDNPGESAPPDPHRQGGVGQGSVLPQAGAGGCDSGAEGQGHGRYGAAAGILPCCGVHAVWRGELKCHAVPAVLCCAVLCYAMLCYAMLCCHVRCCACCAVLCHAVLVILYHTDCVSDCFKH